MGIKKFYYDDNDNWIRAEYYTVDEQPAYDDADGVSIFEMEYNDVGNVVTFYHKDGNGELMLPKKNGVAGGTTEYDDNGFIVKQTCLGTDKTPIFVSTTGYAGYTAKCDKNGFFNEQEFFDPDGNVCETSQGFSKLVMINDNHGNLLEVWQYDINGDLCLDPTGKAGTTWKYDSIGNMIEEIYYDVDKRPALNGQGIAGFRSKYDDRNLLTELLFLDESMNPTFDNNHICNIHNEYDKRGNVTKIAFYDADGTKLVHSNEDVAGWNFIYDDLGNEIERSFFNSNNALCEVVGGYAKKTLAYDKNGHKEAERFYNIQGKLTTVNGIAGTDFVCDERGNKVIEKPISTNGTLAAGRVETHYKYDKFDNCIEECYYSNEKAANCQNGYHTVKRSFNSRNQVIEESYYNNNSQLTLTTNEGIAKLKNEFDNRGLRVRCFYYGTDSKPIIGKEGWASSIYEYDAFGNIIKQCFFGIDGKPTDPKRMVPVGICTYDKHNNMVYIAAQDGNGHFIINPNTGWAISRMEYDNRSKMLSQSFFDENDKPMKGSNGCHKTTYKYNGNGNKTEEAHFGTDGKPASVNGVHLEKYTYDEKGNMTIYALYSQSGKPVNCDAGFHKVVVSYNNGVPVSRKYYAQSGSLLATQSYNRAKAEWNALQGTGSVSSYSVSSSDWKDMVRKANSECPVKVADGVYVQSISYTNGNVIITIKLAEISKYAIDDQKKNEMKEVSSKLKSYLKEELSLPSQVSVVVNFVDKANRSI